MAVKARGRLWEGAFSGAHGDVTRFNSAENVLLDGRLAKYDMLGSIAHAGMLGRQGIISRTEAGAITSALRRLLKSERSGRFTLDPALEDIHTNVEAHVTRITPAGAKIHTARSRNDQSLLDMRMYMRDEALAIAEAVITLQKSFAMLSKNDGVMAGYTHTRIAQPLTISFWCDSFVQGFGRDIERIMGCYGRLNMSPLGACALAGTSWKVNRAYTAKALAFGSVQKNALDAVGSRGEGEAELLSALSILMTKLSGIAEELVWLSQKRLVTIPDEFCTGSSIMPNKKNPDVLELIRGRSGRVYGGLMHVLSVKKGLMSGYHSDMQETKYAVMQGIETTKECVVMLATVVKGIGFDDKAIRTELEQGFAQATEIADALARKGVPFREAHGIVGRLVGRCGRAGITLSEAEPLQPFTPKEWKALVSLDRPRLKVKVAVDSCWAKKVHEEKLKIEKAYAALEGQQG
ncbi:MAG: argininosuccinate lyase [Candidatus ainarchaeum sp.]|nr:argininosuccinate lyase [Candidatus ainarchaeum sp.]